MSGRTSITIHPEEFDLGIEELPHTNDPLVTVTDLASKLGKSRSNFIIKISGMWEVLEQPDPRESNPHKTEASVTTETADKIEAWFTLEKQKIEARRTFKDQKAELERNHGQLVIGLTNAQTALENT